MDGEETERATEEEPGVFCTITGTMETLEDGSVLLSIKNAFYTVVVLEGNV